MTDPNPTPKDELDNLLKAIYGKDVVDNAYASPAGKLTKAEAKKQINAYILGQTAQAELRGVIRTATAIREVMLENDDYEMAAKLQSSIKEAEKDFEELLQRLKLKGDSK